MSLTTLEAPAILESLDGMVMRSIAIDQDAEKLAQMWRESDDQWPGTVSDGVELTTEWARQWHGKQTCLETFVWDAGDVLAGYCSIWEYPEDPNVTYVATLNVAPRFQKQSLARRMLVRSVEYARQRGSPRLDLGTWSGNLKAVPLYKKCGFFWEPGTSVHMMNFMPAILALPAAQPFFQKHDWYASLRRALTQAEDDERWEGMRVFTYRFEQGGDALTVWADASARTITAVETDAFFAAAIAGDPEPPRGLPAPMRWRIANKRAEPMSVSLIASGTPDLKLDHRATLRLAPGETAELSALVEVSPTMADVREGRPAPAVRSLLVIDGEVLELGTGLRPRAAVEASLFPEHTTLTPGVEREALVQLRSRLKHDIAATVSVAPAPGLTTGWTQRTAEVPAGGYASIPIALRAEAAGAYELPIIVSFERDGALTRLPVRQAAVFALAPGGVVGALTDDGRRVQIENEFVRVEIAREGAGAELFERASGAWLASHSGYAAPPLRPSEFWDGTFELSVERADGQVTAVAAMASKTHPGFVLRKRLTVGAGPLIRAAFEFDNLGADARAFQLSQHLRAEGSEMIATLPLAGGLAQGRWELFPGLLDEEQKKPDAYAARWMALEHQHATLGVIWGADVAELELGWGELLSKMHDCPPQSRVRPGETWLYVGHGGWRAVERAWRRMQGQPEAAETRVEPRAPIAARVEPAVFLAGDTTEAALVVEHLRPRKLRGAAELRLPAGWRAEPAAWELEGVTLSAPLRAPLRLEAEARPGAYEGRIALRSDEAHADFTIPLLRLGDGSAVEVREESREGQAALAIDNGRMELLVTPGFAGTVSSLRAGGVEQLCSPFPEAGTFGWLSPWYGGIVPTVQLPNEHTWPGRLYKERFEAAPHAHTDARGNVWRGVRQRAALTQEDGRGLAIEMDVLTLGGSPVVRLALRLVNESGAVRGVPHLALQIFVQPGGSRAATTLWGEGDAQVRSSDRMAWLHVGRWAAAENSASGRALAVVAPQGGAGLLGWGKEGGHLELRLPRPIRAMPGAAAELVGFLALAEDLGEARRFAALCEIAG